MASWVKATEECVQMLYRPGSELPDDVTLHCVCVCVVLWMFWANAWKPHPPSHSATPQSCAWAYGCEPIEAEQAECSGSGAMVCWKEGQQPSAVFRVIPFRRPRACIKNQIMGVVGRKMHPSFDICLLNCRLSPERCATPLGVYANLGFRHKVFRLYSFVT